MNKLTFPPELPVTAHREEIEEAIRRNQVVIVCGDTGSGKTTQLPKMALELGRGANGKRIACTQPRRLAAITVATRVAEEFGEKPGATIGYQHRFEKRVSELTRVKFMTDGVLLAETRSDPLLRAYDTIIIDEAHERSLNIDFLLGILKRILVKRKDLKVIVSSATLDSALFSDFFGGAPALSIPGRLFPIEMRYREQGVEEDSDVARDVAAAVDELPPEGDILVFLSGERDIRETAEALSRNNLAGDEIIPLLASLPSSEQQRAFRLSGRRRIILATNVAETSLTIPGIRYVIDSGLARISRYIHRTQIQRLQIEPVSQASARQRAGRCGRLGPGVCIRLYSEEDFLSRDEYTPPEILRSSLAGVILTMLDLGLGEIETFPFINPPEGPMIREGLRELLELGAIASRTRKPAPANAAGDTSDGTGRPALRDTAIRLTPVGRALAKIPVEPRLARMLLAADRENSLKDVLTIVAALSCDDPRRRPVEEKEKADQAHARFRTPGSDFAGVLKLWRWWEAETSDSSQTHARKLCKANYLSFPKMREWRDLRTQLSSLCKRLGFDVDSYAGGDEGIHKALLAGLLGRIGLYDSEKREYRGARGVRFAPFPGSVLFKKPPQWIMAGELVDTSRLYAREAAVLNPEWIEPVAGPLCKHNYSFPEWDAAHGFVRATEQVTLYGLVVVQARRCDYSRIAPQECREIFIRRGLIDCEFPKAPNLVRDNIAIINEVRRQEEKTRKYGLLDTDRLYAFFDKAVPPDINNADALRKWLRHATRQEIESFRLKREDWVPRNPVSSSDFPEHIEIGGAGMTLSYRHSVDDDDGITCTAKKSDAALLREWRSDWLVPGALPEKLRWMIGCLPSAQRRVLAPAEETVSRLMTYLRPGRRPLTEALAETLQKEWGIPVYSTAWDNIRMPLHFQVRFRIRDNETGKIIASGRDLQEVLSKCGISADTPQKKPGQGKTGQSTSEYPFIRSGMKKWECGNLPERVENGKAGWTLTNYPALHDDGQSVSVQLYSDPVKAAKIHRQGLARLFSFVSGFSRISSVLSPKSRILRPLPMQAMIYLRQIDYAEPRFSDDYVMALSAASLAPGCSVRSAAEFDIQCRSAMQASGKIQAELPALVFNIITLAADISRMLEETDYLGDTAYESMQTQLAWLVFPGFIRNVPFNDLRHYVRYLEAMRVRIDRSARNEAADEAREAQVAEFWKRYRTAATSSGKQVCNEEELAVFRWMIEEFRVSLFAQELRTRYPVSAKRLEEQWKKCVFTR